MPGCTVQSKLKECCIVLLVDNQRNSFAIGQSGCVQYLYWEYVNLKLLFGKLWCAWTDFSQSFYLSWNRSKIIVWCIDRSWISQGNILAFMVTWTVLQDCLMILFVMEVLKSDCHLCLIHNNALLFFIKIKWKETPTLLEEKFLWERL